MRTFKHICLWVVCLVSGGIVGLIMLPIEACVMIVALCLGARDVSWRELGFVFRQLTHIPTLQALYPI